MWSGIVTMHWTDSTIVRRCVSRASDLNGWLEVRNQLAEKSSGRRERMSSVCGTVAAFFLRAIDLGELNLGFSRVLRACYLHDGQCEGEAAPGRARRYRVRSHGPDEFPGRLCRRAAGLGQLYFHERRAGLGERW